MNFDPLRAFEHVKALSFPRLAGTPGDTKARGYIVSYLHSLGLSVEVRTFGFSTIPWELSLRLSLLIQSGILILAAWIFPRWPAASAALALALFGLSCFATRRAFSLGVFDRGGKRETANIIATLGSGSPTVVYMAHYDSKSQTLPLPLRFGLFALGFLFLTGVSLAIVILAVVSAGPDLFPWALASAAPHILLQFNMTTNESDGALDNASGVGVLLELARVLKERTGAPGPGLMFVATGAEEMGLLGATRFIKAYSRALDPKTTYFVNLDGPGAEGRIVYVTGFGVPPVRTCKRLGSLTREILHEKGWPGRDSTLYIGAGLDSIPIAARGYEAVSIASGGLSRPVLSVHSKHDRIGNVDPEALRRCGVLALELALRLFSW